MTTSYLTIEGPAEARYTVKMSRFLAFAQPVMTADEARAFVALIANKYHDARHVCWAYMIGAERDISMVNDNGEPSGTAGKPILGQINSANLTNIVIAVVRYFGGIKLGTPGLIAAYREAARMAIEEATVIERHIATEVTVTYPYLAMNSVMRIAKGTGVCIISQDFDNTCKLTLAIDKNIVEAAVSRLNDIDGAIATIGNDIL